MNKTATTRRAQDQAPVAPLATGFYFGWHDTAKRRTPALKVQDAVNAYQAKFDTDELPRVVLVNVEWGDLVAAPPVAGVQVVVSRLARPNTMYVGNDLPA